MTRALHLSALATSPRMGRNYYRNRRFYGGYVYPNVEKERREAANKKRWLAISAGNTISDRKEVTRTASRLHANESFRLVDGHGTAYGQRYKATGSARYGGNYDAMVSDKHGNTFWLDGRTRVRIVDAQREDLMSQASRILTAEFKRGAR